MYAFGLLSYRDNSFLQLSVPEFLVMVDGALQWQAEQEDRLHEQQSVFVAQLMLVSGNMKKGTKPDKLRKELYMPLADRQKAVIDMQPKHVGKQKVTELRNKIAQNFGITTE